MKKAYKIEVDCPVCAEKIERAINKLDGIASCVISFMTGRAIIEFNEGFNTLDCLKNCVIAGRNIDKDFKIFDHGNLIK